MSSYYSCYIKLEKKLLEMPIIPSELPSIQQGADSEDFLSTKGYRTLIGKRQLFSCDAEFVLPDKSKNLSFQKSKVKGQDLKALLEKAVDKEKPINLVIVDKNGKYYINKKCQVVNFSYFIDKKRDWHISMSLKEWKKY